MSKLKSNLALWFSSSPTKPGEVKKGLTHLKKLGLGVFVSKTFKQEVSKKESLGRPYLASTEKNKIKALAEIRKHFKNSSGVNIFMSRGGYGSLRLLDHLGSSDWKFLAKSRIWGFSDLTSLQNALFFKTGASWVHSPMLTSPPFYNPSKNESFFWKRLCDPKNQKPFVYKLKGSKDFGSRKAVGSAKLIGGNLACFMALFGTPFHPKFASPFFLFLEDVGEKPHRIDRYLNQLSLDKNFLKKCQGIVLGDFTDCPGWRSVLFKWAKEKNIPLVWGMPSGHDRQNFPILMGERVRLRQISVKDFKLEVPNFHFG